LPHARPTTQGTLLAAAIIRNARLAAAKSIKGPPKPLRLVVLRPSA
jgi:hypothetical protein